MGNEYVNTWFTWLIMCPWRISNYYCHVLLFNTREVSAYLELGVHCSFWVLLSGGKGLFQHTGLLRWLSGREPAYWCRRWGLIPGLGRSPGKGNGNLLKYSSLGSPMDRRAWRAIVCGGSQKSWIWSRNLTIATLWRRPLGLNSASPDLHFTSLTTLIILLYLSPSGLTCVQ